MSNYSGVGTDLFIKKLQPGVGVGHGYTIEVFVNGVKKDFVKLRTKKDVLSFIKEYKTKYNTNRAFQNEQQLHITYKTKEERGEVGAMNSLDNTLFRQAYKINSLLQRLLDPEVPIKIRKVAEEALNTSDLPDVAPQGDQLPMDETEVASLMAKRIIAYVQSNQNAPVDDMYNGIKKWIAQVKDAVSHWEKSSSTTLNRDDILGNLKKIIYGKNPKDLSIVIGKPIEPQVLDTVRSILNKKSSYVPQKETVRVRDMKNFESWANKQSDPRDPDLENVMDKIINDIEDKDDYESTVGEHPKTETQQEIAKHLKALESKNTDDAKVEANTKSFWKYAQDYRGTSTLEHVFVKWLSSDNRNLRIAEVSSIWNNINKDVYEIFGINEDIEKEAAYEDAIAIFTVSDVSNEDNPVYQAFFQYKPAVDQTSKPILLVREAINELPKEDDYFESTARGQHIDTPIIDFKSIPIYNEEDLLRAVNEIKEKSPIWLQQLSERAGLLLKGKLEIRSQIAGAAHLPFEDEVIDL